MTVMPSSQLVIRVRAVVSAEGPSAASWAAANSLMRSWKENRSAAAWGETLADSASLGSGSSEVSRHLILRPCPGAHEGDADAYVNPAQFHRLFCAELDSDLAIVLAASQRGLAVSALTTPSPEEAWEGIPSWYLIAARDQVIPPASQRAMAARAAARTVEIDSCHAAMISHPAETADLIRAAAGQHPAPPR
jgi:pimeloyl-ACP methyl ester carboxylesterase